MQNHSLESFGDYLKNERESRDISREELAKATRIGLPFLRALEENDFDFFSRPDLIPGFLRIYARHLDLNFEEVLRRYHLQQEQNPKAEGFQQLPLFPEPQSPLAKSPSMKSSVEKRRSRIPLLLAIIFGCLGVSLSLHHQLSRDKYFLKSLFPWDLVSKIWPKKSSSELPALAEDKKALPHEAPSSAGESSKPTAAELQPQEREPSAKKMKVIGNRDSKRYHLPGMKYYDKVHAYHRVEFDSEEEAIKAGYHKAPR